MKLKSTIYPLTFVLAAMPTVALAHTGVGENSGFFHGFTHPISGLDHILAMVMVGVLAYQLGGRALWLVPMAFVLAMAAAGALGAAGFDVPFVEAGIALSVVVLGMSVALSVKAPAAVVMAIVGLFAVFHGHAHGTEMPDNAGSVAYGAGFMIATALLHVAGIATGFLIGKVGEQHSSRVVRTSGGIAALAGVGILAGIL
ncbi:HupE/UreJ family protein [Agrobacterium sp. P15N1-A]|uniref:HupE/UreJ family protein n=1 Tax=Agrobacterium sp. P15N1-A TaxID=3342820 RepID=UPI0037D87E65